jgi:serine/threonine-protein kinase ATR
MNLNTIRFYSKAIKAGSKYVYQTVPRLLTLWLDSGEDDPDLKVESNLKINQEVSKAIDVIPTYKVCSFPCRLHDIHFFSYQWFPAFPQIASRVGHGSGEVYKLLAILITRIIAEYPKQALWLFICVVKSTKQTRATRGKKLLDRLKVSPNLVSQYKPLIRFNVKVGSCV